MSNTLELSKVIGYEKGKGSESGRFVVGKTDVQGNSVEAAFTETEVNELLTNVFANGTQADHEALAAQIVEPIRQVIPYVEAYAPIFFMDANYGYTEDNSIPVENLPTMAWQTSANGQILYNSAGISWTRPDFVFHDAGIRLEWNTFRRAGWNYLARQMGYAMDNLTRKRDKLAHDALETALPAGSNYPLGGGVLTKAAVDEVLRDKAEIGYPVKNVLINPARMMDMFTSSWAMPTGVLLSPTVTDGLLRTLTYGNYGGATWYANPFVAMNEVWFGGDKSEIGWRQTQGTLETKSDVDITRKADLHAIYDAGIAFYVGNPYTLARIYLT